MQTYHTINLSISYLCLDLSMNSTGTNLIFKVYLFTTVLDITGVEALPLGAAPAPAKKQ